MGPRRDCRLEKRGYGRAFSQRNPCKYKDRDATCDKEKQYNAHTNEKSTGPPCYYPQADFRTRNITGTKRHSPNNEEFNLLRRPNTPKHSLHPITELQNI